jgi:hypothetical protein
MSLSKASDRNQSIKSVKDAIASIVVESTESAFYLKVAHDDGGSHLMLYLPESIRDEFDLNKFREATRAKAKRKRVLLCFVHDECIESFLKG